MTRLRCAILRARTTESHHNFRAPHARLAWTPTDGTSPERRRQWSDVRGTFAGARRSSTLIDDRARCVVLVHRTLRFRGRRQRRSGGETPLRACHEFEHGARETPFPPGHSTIRRRPSEPWGCRSSRCPRRTSTWSCVETPRPDGGDSAVSGRGLASECRAARPGACRGHRADGQGEGCRAGVVVGVA